MGLVVMSRPSGPGEVLLISPANSEEEEEPVTSLFELLFLLSLLLLYLNLYSIFVSFILTVWCRYLHKIAISSHIGPD